VIFGRLGCARVSLWRFDGTAPNLRLLCIASRSRGEPLDTVEHELNEPEYRDYFNAIVEGSVHVCNDTLADARLAPMLQNFLRPNRVRALLDAAVLVNGRAFGMVCCEEVDAPRAWSAGDAAALRAIVNKLALLLAGAGDPALWRSPSLPMEPL
jgi:GAF domain-containing protein